jgi:hypothetical protein
MIIPTFFMERAPMLRERASRFYAVLPWVQAMEDVELPWVAAQVQLILRADDASCMHEVSPIAGCVLEHVQ